MPDRRRQVGNFGEQVALGYLLRQGLAEVARQWRCRGGEIDLVMREGETLVFVEVRTRRDGMALESVGAQKQARLMALAYSYLDAHPEEQGREWRIDVVGIWLGPGGAASDIEWLRSAVGE
ncbi:YraN family protein [Chloroflexia bacterium SDU3-3]|nr:YraN family protein [Chloroflexia bacterium SDU3-3]